MATSQRDDHSSKDFTASHKRDHKPAEHYLSPSPLTAFCEFMSSPNWLYPTARFFGHALYGNKNIVAIAN